MNLMYLSKLYRLNKLNYNNNILSILLLLLIYKNNQNKANFKDTSSNLNTDTIYCKTKNNGTPIKKTKEVQFNHNFINKTKKSETKSNYDIKDKTTLFSDTYKNTNLNNSIHFIKNIINDIHHLSNATIITNNELDTYNNIPSSNAVNKQKIKILKLLVKCHINDSFKGTIKFSNYIHEITNIENKLILTENLLLLHINEENKGTLFLDGYLETSIDYSIPLSFNVPLKCKISNYVVRTPFKISKPINLEYKITDIKNAFSNLDFSLSNISFNMRNIYLDTKPLEELINLHKEFHITINVNYDLELFKENI
ncbi:hypothetical protein ACFO6R_03080 [Eubacterium multiforme]|uniref:Uncharacterized protein n=1 Tax=Eubacterium multiforme TaxID=83339 RepID=A0ABT9UR99_9FIRM|nr:hypothetical protein [Eubacterium multiforme]MDQ0148260.1 hypothetical protein [Eubacterium multiforme]